MEILSASIKSTTTNKNPTNQKTPTPQGARAFRLGVEFYLTDISRNNSLYNDSKLPRSLIK